MSTLSQSDKEEIAAELDRVATWVAGPRQAKVKALAARVRGEEVEEPKAHDADSPE
jgi:hypothetical protein